MAEAITPEAARAELERRRSGAPQAAPMQAVTPEQARAELGRRRAIREEEARANVNSGVDFARSVPTGVQRGITGTLGLPGDLRELGRNIIEPMVAQAESFFTRGRRMDETELERHLEERRQHPLYQLGEVVMPAFVGGDTVVRQPTSEDLNSGIERVQGFPQYEPQTTAGEYGRTIGEFAVGAASPGGAVTRTARVVAPAVVSETAGQLTEGTPLEPWARLAGALGGAGVTEGFIIALTRGGLTPDERAVRLIVRELEDQGQSPEDIVRQANILLRQAPTEEVIAETLGDGGLRLARAVAAMGRGAGRSTANETLAARAEGRPSIRQTTAQPGQRATTSIRDRIMDEAARTTAPAQTRAPRDYWDALEALRTARSGQGREAYRAAHEAKPDANAVATQLIPYMRDAPREWFTSGIRQLETEAARQRARIAEASMGNRNPEVMAALSREMDDILAARTQLAKFANGEVPNAVNSRAIDYFQRGILQMERAAGRGSPEAGALSEARSAYNQMADRVNPAFGEARTRYGESIRIEDLMNEGRRVFNMSEGEIDRLMRGGGRGLSTEEFDGFMLGVMDAIETKLGASDTGFLARLMRNQNWRNQLTTAVGGETQARRFLDRLAREARMQETRNFVQSGSRTQPIAEDIRALTQGEAELGFMADREARDFVVQAGKMALRNPVEAAIRAVTWIYDRTSRPGIANPEVQAELARRLFTRVTRESSKELRDAIYALQTSDRLNPGLRNFLQNMTAANAVVGDGANGEPSGSLRDEYVNARRAVDEGAP